MHGFWSTVNATFDGFIHGQDHGNTRVVNAMESVAPPTMKWSSVITATQCSEWHV